MDGRCRKVGHTLSVREFIILNSEKEETFPAAVGGWGGGQGFKDGKGRAGQERQTIKTTLRTQQADSVTKGK